MTDFHVFQTAIQQKFTDMSVNKEPLFVSDVDSRELWTTYLDSFPEGTNELYKERREYDCQCCKAFIRRFGHVVTIKNNKMVSIWDVDVPFPFDEVVKTLSRYVKSGNKIKDAFFSKEQSIGVKKSHQQLDNSVITWDHFYIKLPNIYVKTDIAPVLGTIRDSKQVFQRSMQELTVDAAETIKEFAIIPFAYVRRHDMIMPCRTNGEFMELWWNHSSYGSGYGLWDGLVGLWLSSRFLQISSNFQAIWRSL